MENTIWILAIIIVALLLFSKNDMNTSDIKFYHATIQDVPYILKSVKETGKEHSYATIVFNSSEAVEGSHIELQFSKENDVVGFDWVLLGFEKTRDEKKFVDLATSKGHEVVLHELNNVKYLRIEGGDLSVLCLDIMRSLYKVTDNQHLELIAKNIDVNKLDLITE